VDLPVFGPGRAKKRHSFHGWRKEAEGGAVNPRSPQGRGSEHGTHVLRRAELHKRD
jgi:hypothetical protein